MAAPSSLATDLTPVTLLDSENLYSFFRDKEINESRHDLKAGLALLATMNTIHIFYIVVWLSYVFFLPRRTAASTKVEAVVSCMECSSFFFAASAVLLLLHMY